MVYDGYNTDRIEELLMRPDGKRVKDLPPIVAAIPYIMPKRYDAWNTITENIDEEGIKAYIREKRRAGIRINHMAVIIAAYYKAYQTNPKLNWFVVNSHLYERNHFCVSFVILKKRADGSPDETTLKIYLELAVGKRESGGVYIGRDKYLMDKFTSYSKKQLAANAAALAELQKKLAAAEDEEQAALIQKATKFGLAALENREDCEP